MQKENQDIVAAILISSLFVLIFGVACFLIMLRYFKKKRSLLLEQQIQEEKMRQRILEAQLEMQEHTFRIVSQEIHDNVGQILSLAKINLNVITLEQSENENFHRIKDLVANAIAELRDLGTGYYAEKLAEEGLVSSVRNQLDHLTKTGLFKTSFESEIEYLRLEKNSVIFLHRMVQEVLNNIVKHSGATKVSIRIFKNENKVQMRIEDNGRGFVTSSIGFRPGIGLSSIQQRASMIGATADIQSTPQSGTIVNFTF